MTGFTSRNGTLYVDDIPCSAIAEKVGTPVFVYSAKKVAAQYRRLQTALNNVYSAPQKPLITFACKANSNIAIMRLLGSLGCGADVVSGGEVRRALAAGIPADKIVFSGVGKTRAELDEALTLGLHQINVETAGELDVLIELARDKGVKPAVAFRYTPNVESFTHAKISTGEDDHKFGLLEDEILTLYARAHASGVIEPKGISVHIGSQIFELTSFEQAFLKVAALITKLRGMGLPVTVADLGGGLGVDYQDSSRLFDVEAYAKLIDKVFSSLGVAVMLEPGRFLVGECGALITEVTYIKDRPERRFVIVDAGMNDLIRPTLYEAYHPIVPLEPVEGEPVQSDIVGPVCETGDYFALERLLPPVKAGNLIAVLMAGAYGSAMSSHYNSRAFVAEVMVNGDVWDIVRKRQPVEAIWANEVIPGWLK